MKSPVAEKGDFEFFFLNFFVGLRRNKAKPDLISMAFEYGNVVSEKPFFISYGHNYKTHSELQPSEPLIVQVTVMIGPK